MAITFHKMEIDGLVFGQALYVSMKTFSKMQNIIGESTTPFSGIKTTVQYGGETVTVYQNRELLNTGRVVDQVNGIHVIVDDEMEPNTYRVGENGSVKKIKFIEKQPEAGE